MNINVHKITDSRGESKMNNLIVFTGKAILLTLLGIGLLISLAFLVLFIIALI